MAKEPDPSETLESIVDQFTTRIRAGEHPSIAEYQELHPNLKDEIEDLLASVAMIEQLKSNPTNIDDDRRSLDEVSHLKQIGEYQVVGEIGRGGMGIVFEAIHQSLGRRVAIKVMPTPIVNRQQYAERFKRESQAAARMHHTNIVGVFGVGEENGFHYYVMDFVDGQTLGEVILGLSHAGNLPTTRVNEETRLESSKQQSAMKLSPNVKDSEILEPGSTPQNSSVSDQSGIRTDSQEANRRSVDELDPKHFRWAARLGANIADALAYAHGSSILHRDIKPSNIILDRKGVVWITDFGLAKDSSNEINLTKTGDVIGTPQYLAPESLEGKYDIRSEVYCLGLTLYELATLQPAYKSGTTAEVIGAIATSSPVSPRKITRRIPLDLSTIIDKAVSRDPKLRYQTAGELQKDLLAFVEDRPIAARPPSTLENVVKWSRRNPLPAALSVISALLLMLVAISATLGFLSTMDALEKEANKSAKLLDQQKQTERQRLVAVEERKKMQVEYDRAEGNIAITLEAFDEMFKQVVKRGSSTSDDIRLDGFDELTGIETSITREDAAFLDKLLVFYDQFAKQNVDNDTLRTESARAFRRVANIFQLIGVYHKAVESYKSSIDGYEKALEQSPNSKEILIALVNTKCEISCLHRRNEQWREAIGQYQSAIELFEQVPIDQVDNNLKLEMARTRNSLGSSSALIATYEKSRPELYEQLMKAMRPRRRSGDRRPPDDRHPPSHSNRKPPRRFDEPSSGRSPEGRGDPRRPPNSPTQMVSYHSRKAIEIMDELVKSEPANLEYRSVRANCYCSLAAATLKSDPDQSVEFRDLAIEEFESLIETDENNHEYQYRLAVACSLSNQEKASALEQELIRKSVKIADDLAERFPQFLDYHILLISVRVRYADQLMKDKKLAGALDSLQRCNSSLDKIKTLSRSDRTQRTTVMTLGGQFLKLANEADKAGDNTLARQTRNALGQMRNRNKLKSKDGN